jgi:hypothetical protein
MQGFSNQPPPPPGHYHHSRRSHAMIWQIIGVIVGILALIWSIGWSIYGKLTASASPAPQMPQENLVDAAHKTPRPTAVPKAALTSTPGPMLTPTTSPMPTATLAVGCYDSACDGQPPDPNNCIPGEVLVASGKIYNNEVPVATVEFYVSQACATGWVNVETPPGTIGDISAEVNTGAYTQQYCYPMCPVQQHSQPYVQNVHTVMIHTNKKYLLWGRGCYFPKPNQPLCFPQASDGEYEFNGFWPQPTT